MKIRSIKIKRTKNQIITEILIAVLVVVLIGFSLFDFICRVQAIIHDRAEQTLMDTGEQSARLLGAQINRDFNFLNTLAVMIVEDGDLDDPEAVERKLQSSVKNYSFDRMAVILANGEAYANDGERANLSERAYFKEALSGKITVSNVVTSIFTGQEAMVLAVPIYSNNEVVGVLQGSYVTNFFNDVVDFESYGGKGSTYVIQTDGSIVIKSEGKKRDTSHQTNLSEADVQSILENMSERKIGFSQFEIDNEMMFYSYVPVKINDWYVITVVSEKDVMEQVDAIGQMALVMCIKIIVTLLFVSIYTFMAQRKMYRLEDERKEAKRLDDERYQILLENLNSVIFEWDINEDSLTYSKEWKEQLGYEPTLEMFKNCEIVSEEERLSLGGFFEMIRGNAVDYGEEEYRMKKSDGSMLWYRIRLGGIKDQSGNTRRIMGLLEDIDSQKARENDLMDRAQRDSLTNLYNKKTVEKKVSYIIKNDYQNGEIHGLLLLDIDDFKKVNDTYGHGVGDKVLIEIAQKLEKLFREPDIKGRIGGDEFMIMMRNIKSVNMLHKRGTEIIEAFKSIEVTGLHGITCSVGIAVVPEDGQDFATLYRHADEAMYYAKNKGKNNFALYSETTKKME